nr:MAG TPA: hypothetical protein [Caudoviricetes sp.]DAS23226.1 MAG TPA: hypothetical protein [Caudoviricetes sp.]DAW34492.1 MAG TPA: hypothetical protein [Caudoviricetes sp.]
MILFIIIFSHTYHLSLLKIIIVLTGNCSKSRILKRYINSLPHLGF